MSNDKLRITIISLFLVGLMPTISFYLLNFFNFKLIYSFFGSFIIFLLFLWLFFIFHNDPFLKLFWGEGQLILTLDSSGVIQPYILKTTIPFLSAKIGDKEIKQKYDKNIFFYINEPIITKEKIYQTEEGDIIFRLSKEDFQKSKFKFWKYNVLFYNKILGSFLTKDFILEKEHSTFLEYLLLNLQWKLTNLDETLTNFFRKFGDMFKRISSFIADVMSNPIVILIIIAFLIILSIKLYPLLSNSINKAGQTISNITLGGGLVVPQ